MRIVQVNSVLNVGSTGRIAEGIGEAVTAAGHDSFIAYGRRSRPSKSKVIRVGSKFDLVLHGMRSVIAGQHGLGSVKATERLVHELNHISPDVVHLHNIHGYYINYEVLFSFLAESGVNVVWTLHDCWAFTGHCAYFDEVGCVKWKDECNRCPLLHKYPLSIRDNSCANFRLKKKLFSSVRNMTIVTPSSWLAKLVSESFLDDFTVQVIPYGINLDGFKPIDVMNKENIVLGVANPWSQRKGLQDFVSLRKILPDHYRIVLIGLTNSQIRSLPKGIEGLPPTDSIQQLSDWYARSSVFVNCTYSDNFPVVNLESLACGTPVITYDTGGSPEAICEKTGCSVEQGNVEQLARSIIEWIGHASVNQTEICRARASRFFCSKRQFAEYVRLYENTNG